MVDASGLPFRIQAGTKPKQVSFFKDKRILGENTPLPPVRKTGAHAEVGEYRKAKRTKAEIYPNA
jgi:hypothetical protein